MQGCGCLEPIPEGMGARRGIPQDGAPAEYQAHTTFTHTFTGVYYSIKKVMGIGLAVLSFLVHYIAIDIYREF